MEQNLRRNLRGADYLTCAGTNRRNQHAGTNYCTALQHFDADLRRADLHRANLSTPELRVANLRGADLQDRYPRG